MKDKIILAYSGGLDTSATIPWLKNNYDCEVIAVCINVGQGELEGLEERAIQYGAEKCLLLDCVDQFAEEYLSKLVMAGGHSKYEGQYLLGSAIARPLIAQHLVAAAKAEGAVAICHGATGKGNDQVRFELTIKALDPSLKVIAPWRIWDIKSREDATEYLVENGFEPPLAKEQSYSRDGNLWHISSEGLELENPAVGANLDKVLQMSVSAYSAPDRYTEVELTFEQGIVVAIDGEKMTQAQAIAKLNQLGGANGIGIIDMVENRMVGMKSRGVYETPGGTILIFAHDQLELLTLDKELHSFKADVSKKFGELVYGAKWHTPLREALVAFLEQTQTVVTGTVKLKLYKGNIIPNGITSANSLYIEDLASFATGELYDHKDAEGFINLYGLPLTVQALVDQGGINE